MTVKEACAYLRVSRVTLYALMARGQLRWVELPGVRGRRFERHDLDAVKQEGPRR